MSGEEGGIRLASVGPAWEERMGMGCMVLPCVALATVVIAVRRTHWYGRFATEDWILFGVLGLVVATLVYSMFLRRVVLYDPGRGLLTVLSFGFLHRFRRTHLVPRAEIRALGVRPHAKKRRVWEVIMIVREGEQIVLLSTLGERRARIAAERAERALEQAQNA